MSHPTTLQSILERCHTDENGCIVWTGCLSNKGYPYIGYKGRSKQGSRVVWQLVHGDIKNKNICVLHSCDNRKCVNIKHLRLGTQLENMRDASARKRFKNSQKTHCHKGHPLSGDNIRPYKGHRVCRSCMREYQRKINGHKPRSRKDAYLSFDKRDGVWRIRARVNGKIQGIKICFSSKKKALAFAKNYKDQSNDQSPD